MKNAVWLLFLFLPAWVQGCPSGYESQAALAKAARLIIGVRVESVNEVKAAKSRHILATDENEERQDAQARVKVTECIRGVPAASCYCFRCPIRGSRPI